MIRAFGDSGDHERKRARYDDSAGPKLYEIFRGEVSDILLIQCFRFPKAMFVVFVIDHLSVAAATMGTLLRFWLTGDI